MTQRPITTKLPKVGTTIFSRMSALAQEHGAYNLAQGFPDFDAPEALREAVARRVMNGDNQYAPMAGTLALREQVCAHVSHYRDVECCPESEVTIVPGATEGIYCTVTALVRPGDEVILLDPCYDSYEPAIELSGGRAVHVPLHGDGFRPNWDAVEAALTPRTRMIIINTPHNPCGSTLHDEDMLQLEALAETNDLWVVSDEVYEHLVFDGRKHHSILQYPGLRDRSVAVFSFGKTFSVTGWKTGYCIASPALTAELRKVHQFVSFVAVTPVQLGLADFMTDNLDYPGTLAAFYQAKRDLFCKALEPSRFSFQPTEGSFFQLLDYSTITDTPDHVLCEEWTRLHGVASIPVSIFYEQPPKQSVLRFCFAKSDRMLLKVAETLCKI